MENKQKRKLLVLIYHTIFLFSLIALATATYFCIDKILNNSQVLWLDICMLVYIGLILLFILIDTISTRKMYNKYNLAKFLYTIFVTSFIALVSLIIFVYVRKIEILDYVSYFLPLGLIFATEIVLLFNFVIGLSLSKLHKSTTVTLDSVSETPTFDDEVVLKKRLDELNRKLEMKKVQEKIDKVQKELDE